MRVHPPPPLHVYSCVSLSHAYTSMHLSPPPPPSSYFIPQIHPDLPSTIHGLEWAVPVALVDALVMVPKWDLSEAGGCTS
jgi:hypothetical protein